MIERLDWNELRRLLGQPLQDLSPSIATDIVLRLGGLARWCLSPDVLRLAAENDAIQVPVAQAWRQRLQLPETHGSCWVIFAAGAAERLAALRPAFALPLRWVQNQPHSPHLPTGLVQLAEQVLAAFAEHDHIKQKGWGLQPAASWAGTDVSDMPLGCRSGWASLAAGLLVAADQGTPDRHVWASGSWDASGGIQPIDYLPEKLALASEYQAWTFFVPVAQVDEARKISHGIEIGRLQMAEQDPGRALADLTLRLQTPPPPPRSVNDQEGFKHCVRYHANLPRGAAKTVEYYVSHLLPTIIYRSRQQLLEQYPDCQPTQMVTIVSGSPELVLLAAHALDIRRCLLLYTPSENPSHDQTGRMEMVRRLLQADGRDCVPAAFANDKTLEHEIPAAIHQFAQGQSPDTLVLDLTPGTKWMTLIADRSMPAGSWRMYVNHDTLSTRDNRPEPGSERLTCWRN